MKHRLILIVFFLLFSCVDITAQDLSALFNPDTTLISNGPLEKELPKLIRRYESEQATIISNIIDTYNQTMGMNLWVGLKHRNTFTKDSEKMANYMADTNALYLTGKINLAKRMFQHTEKNSIAYREILSRYNRDSIYKIISKLNSKDFGPLDKKEFLLITKEYLNASSIENGKGTWFCNYIIDANIYSPEIKYDQNLTTLKEIAIRQEKINRFFIMLRKEYGPHKMEVSDALANNIYALYYWVMVDTLADYYDLLAENSHQLYELYLYQLYVDSKIFYQYKFCNSIRNWDKPLLDYLNKYAALEQEAYATKLPDTTQYNVYFGTTASKNDRIETIQNFKNYDSIIKKLPALELIDTRVFTSQRQIKQTNRRYLFLPDQTLNDVFLIFKENEQRYYLIAIRDVYFDTKENTVKVLGKIDIEIMKYYDEILYTENKNRISFIPHFTFTEWETYGAQCISYNIEEKDQLYIIIPPSTPMDKMKEMVDVYNGLNEVLK